jgi:nucleotidyltransferase/DNA polymerase involved in DNA repair
MSFNPTETAALLELKGVGPTVLKRLNEIGLTSLAQLRGQDPLALTQQISDMMGSTCWHNSPQARSAITAIVELAARSVAE